MGYAYENEAYFIPASAGQRQLEKINIAMSHYDKALKLTEGGDKNKPAQPYLYYYTLLCLARLNELRNDPASTAKAIEIYNQVLKSRPVPVPQTNKDKEKPPRVGHAGAAGAQADR